MKKIAVYCGASSGNNPVYVQQAYHLGKTLAKRGIELIYGGGKIGLMGAVANGVIEESGRVIGVIPHFLSSKEIAHDELTELIVVENMHVRKTTMHELSDGVIALPGGYGTMEELFEMLTWAQLGLHSKPIGILNIAGFYDALIQFVDHMVDKELLKTNYYQMLLVSDNIDDLLRKMENYKSPEVERWTVEETE